MEELEEEEREVNNCRKEVKSCTFKQSKGRKQNQGNEILNFISLTINLRSLLGREILSGMMHGYVYLQRNLKLLQRAGIDEYTY